MRVAVVIPARNAERSIAQTIDAVRRQTRPADEIVVVDNGSIDGTGAAASAAGACVVREGRRGSYAARNTGIRSTRSEIIAFTDADCAPHPTWLERLLDRFRDEVDVVGGNVVDGGVATVAERWAAARKVLSQDRAFHHAFMPYFATANVAWRRDALERIGGFDASLASGGDVDASWRLQRAGGVLAFQPEAAVTHRHRSTVRKLLAQQIRYADGHGRLDRRWSHDPSYRAAGGTRLQRTRPLWLLPLRVPTHALRGHDPRLPAVDALVVVVREIARARGRLAPPAPALLSPTSPPVPDRL